MSHVIEMLGIRKEFPGIVANDDIYLRVEEGEYDADGNWVMRRVLNGDETDWKGPHIGSSPKMLRIRTYAR